jgi:DNA-binding NarL/FixJ family response regulator
VTDSIPFFQVSDVRLRVAPSWGTGVERQLMNEAMVADEQSSSETDLSLTWRELVQGLSVVVGTFFGAERCGVVLAATELPCDPPFSGRRLSILESILCGVGQKRIAIELGLAPSTVALNASLALQGLGVSGRPSRVHPLLMRAAAAAREHQLVAGSVSFIRHGDIDLQVIGIARPDRRLADVLPAAELEVVRYLLEGRCYADMAKRRGTSERTIANQIAAVFKRMKVSGRSELLLRLFELEGSAPRLVAADSVPPPPPTVRHSRPFQPAPSNDSRISGIRPVSTLTAEMQSLVMASRG